jgi:hypothetical protein
MAHSLADNLRYWEHLKIDYSNKNAHVLQDCDKNTQHFWNKIHFTTEFQNTELLLILGVRKSLALIRTGD